MTKKDLTPESEFDSEELTRLAISYGERASVIRSYCIHVLDANMNLTEWRKADRRAPSSASWTQRYSLKGRYWGHPDDHDPQFRQWIDEYYAAMLKAQTGFMLSEARRAQAELQRSPVMAARRIKEISLKDDNIMVAFQAAKFIYGQQVRALVTPDEAEWDAAETTAGDDGGEVDATE